LKASIYAAGDGNLFVFINNELRTAVEIIDNINRQGQIVATAMNNLRGLLVEE